MVRESQIKAALQSFVGMTVAEIESYLSDYIVKHNKRPDAKNRRCACCPIALFLLDKTGAVEGQLKVQRALVSFGMNRVALPENVSAFINYYDHKSE